MGTIRHILDVEKIHHYFQINLLKMDFANMGSYERSDSDIVRSIGDFVKMQRMSRKMTQEDLAERAGINRTTVINLEKGESVTLVSLIQVLRALRKLDVLGTFQFKTELSPLKVAAMQIKTPSRIRKPKLGKEGRLKQRSDW